MHEQMKRLYAAALEASGTIIRVRQSDLARRLNKSSQVIKNWESRGVSKEGALLAEELLGISAAFILKGMKPMLRGAQPDSPDENDASKTCLAYQQADPSSQAVVDAILGVGKRPPWFDNSAVRFIAALKESAGESKGKKPRRAA